jgi:hypothetical protein
LNLERQDGLALLRRARPRAYHKRWRGHPRRAQDHFDAAAVLSEFYRDLTGELPARPELWPLDGRQAERAALYERGPVPRMSRKELKEELLAAELYPHGVHLVGEGESEQIAVERLVTAILGPRALQDLAFYDLDGTGAAKSVPPLVQAFQGYAIRALVWSTVKARWRST